MANCLFCKFLAYRRIPFRQPDDLRCFGLKIKRNLAPFAVVVHLIQVDSGGDFLFAFGLGFAFQPNHVKHPGFCQQTGQMIHGFTVGPFCTTGRAALKRTASSSKVNRVLMGLTRPQAIQMAFLFSKRVCSR